MRGCYSSHGNTDGILIRPLRGAYAPLFVCLNINYHGKYYRGLDGFSRGVTFNGSAEWFLGVRFVGRKLFTYQRITFQGRIVPFSRVYIPGGTKIALLFGKYAYYF